MEGQSSQNELQLLPLDFNWNAYDASHLDENYPYQHYLLGDGNDEFPYVYSPLPQWTTFQQNPHTYVEFLAENGVSELQGDILHSNISGMTSSFQQVFSSLDMDAQQAIYMWPHNESSLNNFTSAEHRIHGEASQTQNSNECHTNASQPHWSVFPSKPRRTVSRQRASAAERLRKKRIAERIEALQELLPQSKEADQAAVVDYIIDHIKYLQTQIKDLSRDRLGGEPTSHPFVYLEGYGLYLQHEEMINKPLEEIMGKLLEVYPSAAGQLLQSRGLFMMPMSTGEEGLHQPT